MFRVAAILAVAVLAHGVSLEHKDAAVDSKLATIAQSSFGSTVLAQLQDQITQGTPADELKNIIADIYNRLVAAQQEDAWQMGNYTEQCEQEQAQLQSEIDQITSDIADKKLEIEAKENQIATLTDQIAALADKIIRDEEVIQEIMAAISDNDFQYSVDQSLYKNRTDATNLCLEAIDEIRNIDPSGKLTAGQDETAADYQNSDIYNEKLGLLEKLATRVHDPTVLAFIQTTSLAMASLDKGDVDQLYALLDQLEGDLKAYLTELDTCMAAVTDAYNAKSAALSGELADAVAVKEADIAEKGRKEAAKGQAQLDLKKLDQELVELESLLANTKAEKAAGQVKCTDLASAYSDRTADREDELETLKQIKAIIDEKFGDVFKDHINENIDTSVGGSQEA